MRRRLGCSKKRHLISPGGALKRSQCKRALFSRQFPFPPAALDSFSSAYKRKIEGGTRKRKKDIKSGVAGKPVTDSRGSPFHVRIREPLLSGALAKSRPRDRQRNRYSDTETMPEEKKKSNAQQTVMIEKRTKEEIGNQPRLGRCSECAMQGSLPLFLPTSNFV